MPYATVQSNRHNNLIQSTSQSHSLSEKPVYQSISHVESRRGPRAISQMTLALCLRTSTRRAWQNTPDTLSLRGGNKQFALE